MSSSADDEEFDIPVTDSRPSAPASRSAEPGLPPEPLDAPDWTRAKSVRDDPESLGDEARKLWDAVRTQFVEPLLRNYPDAAGHLSNAGGELVSAVRSLIRGSEQVWAGPGARAEDPAQVADVVEVLDGEAPDGDAEHPTQG